MSYLTVGFGSVVFWHWLKGAEDREVSETLPAEAGNIDLQ